MKKNALVVFAAVAVVLTLLAIPFLDRPLAELVRASGLEGAWLFASGTVWLDTITGKPIYLPGILLLGGGTILASVRHLRRYGFTLLFIGLAQSVTYLLTLAGKYLFGRLRPLELLAGNGWDQVWFAGGNAFPSGHTTFYFGLFLPLAYLFPRWRWPLLAVPFFIAIARITGNHHFLSDVTAAMAVAAIVTLAMGVLMERRMFTAASKPESPS